MAQKTLYGGMEGGGTKFVCMVASGPDEIVEEIRFVTTTTEQTIGKAVTFFQKYADRLTAIGLAPFGPLDLNRSSSTYGFITATPKPGWSNTDLITQFRQAFEIPLAIDVDVNAAAFGEYTWVPENRGLDLLVYFTIGTGIGAGIVINNKPVHGLTHPEAGHMRLPHDWTNDPFPGTCPFHGDCFEGLACGLAISQRWGCPAERLPDDHPAWELEATYISAALNNIICTLSPQRIVLGGGVMKRNHLFPAIRQKVQTMLNGYLPTPVIVENEKIAGYIVPPSLGNRSGVLGAVALAKALINRGE
jgi:fructokinase